MSFIAETPPPPYYAVIFTSQPSDADEGYEATAVRMIALARSQPGFLGLESARQGIGITVSYWPDLESIAAWKGNTEHLQAQQKGREQWYSRFRVLITRVEREYGW